MIIPRKPNKRLLGSNFGHRFDTLIGLLKTAREIPYTLVGTLAFVYRLQIYMPFHGVEFQWVGSFTKACEIHKSISTFLVLALSCVTMHVACTKVERKDGNGVHNHAENYTLNSQFTCM